MSFTTDEGGRVYHTVGPNGENDGPFRYHTRRDCRALKSASRTVRNRPLSALDDRWTACKWCSGDAQSPTQGDQSGWKILRDIGESRHPDKEASYR